MPSTTNTSTMSAIATEKASITAQMTRLQARFTELEAAERVLTRYSGKTPGEKSTSAAAPQSTATRRRGRPAKAATASKATKAAASGGIKLGQACWNVVEKYPNGCSSSQIMAGLKSEYGLTPRPNHLGIALQREKRGGRLQERGGNWYTPEAARIAA